MLRKFFLSTRRLFWAVFAKISSVTVPAPCPPQLAQTSQKILFDLIDVKSKHSLNLFDEYICIGNNDFLERSCDNPYQCSENEYE